MVGGLFAASAPARRTTERFKPAADIHLGVALSAEMQGVGLIRLFLVPLIDAQICVTTVNRKPSDRGRALFAADLTLIDVVDQESSVADWEKLLRVETILPASSLA